MPVPSSCCDNNVGWWVLRGDISRAQHGIATEACSRACHSVLPQHEGPLQLPCATWSGLVRVGYVQAVVDQSKDCACRRLTVTTYPWQYTQAIIYSRPSLPRHGDGIGCSLLSYVW